MNNPLPDIAPAQGQNKQTFNVEIGRRLQLLRLQHRLSQEKLGNKLGVTFQQIQKYEKGSNTISLHKLLQICEIFGVDYTHFLGDLQGKSLPPVGELNTGGMRAAVVFSKLDRKIQKSFLGLMEAISHHDES